MMVVIGGMGDDCDKLVSLKEGSGGCFAPVTTSHIDAATAMALNSWGNGSYGRKKGGRM
jgi:hypothetical protein